MRGQFPELARREQLARRITEGIRLAAGEQWLFQGLCQPGFVLIGGPPRYLHQLPVDLRLSEGQHGKRQ
jgi:hypothetical protein